MSMMSVEQVEQIQATQAANESSKKNWINDLRGLAKIGDQVQVQFVGIKSISDVLAQYTHVMHLKSKKGNSYKLYVPCLDQGSGTVHCPICHGKVSGVDYNGNATDDSKKDLLTPLLMIDLHKKFDTKANGFVDEVRPTTTPQGTQLVAIGPQVVKRMNTSKRFRDAFVKFVREQGDLTNKVVTIEVTRWIEKDGKPSNKGTALDFNYAFSINSMIQPVNEADFDIPKVEDLFSQFTETDMDRFINTGSFYEKKEKDDETAAPTQTATPADVAMPDGEAPAADVGNLQGVSFRKRTE